MNNSRRAVIFVILAYSWWGLSAIFWRALDTVAPVDQLGFRVGFGALFLLVWSLARRNHPFAELTPRHMWFGALSAFLIAVNWAVFLWAIDNDQAVEAALGHFLMPLMSVALGVLALGERLSTNQRIALGLATIGLVWTFVVIGAVPWVALALGSSFALYGWARKVGPWNSVDGLTFEMSLVGPFVVGLVLWRAGGGTEVLGDGEVTTMALIVATGFVTIVPLLLFASAARTVSLTAVGLLQYINPTLQFLVGWQLFGEEVTAARLLGFAWIWLALVFVVRGELRASQERSATADRREQSHPNSDRPVAQGQHSATTQSQVRPRSEAAPLPLDPS